MVKRFIRDWKNILKIITSIILCAVVFSLVEIFLSKGILIVYSIIIALGVSVTLTHLFFQIYKYKLIKELLKETDLKTDDELLKDVKFYDLTGMGGKFGLIVDGFDAKGKSLKCRLMNFLELIPIFFIAIQSILAVILGKSISFLWALEVLCFFLMLNINIHLSYIYKNSFNASKQIKNYVNVFEKHILLNGLMMYAYIFIEIIIVALGFVCLFVSPINHYWWVIFIAFIIAIVGILFGSFAWVKSHKINN